MKARWFSLVKTCRDNAVEPLFWIGSKTLRYTLISTHYTFCMHSHKRKQSSNTHPYKYTHIHTCLICVLTGTVAVGESVLETLNRLRLAKQIITSSHWQASCAQCVCVRACDFNYIDLENLILNRKLIWYKQEKACVHGNEGRCLIECSEWWEGEWDECKLQLENVMWNGKKNPSRFNNTQTASSRILSTHRLN